MLQLQSPSYPHPHTSHSSLSPKSFTVYSPSCQSTSDATATRSSLPQQQHNPQQQQQPSMSSHHPQSHQPTMASYQPVYQQYPAPQPIQYSRSVSGYGSANGHQGSGTSTDGTMQTMIDPHHAPPPANGSQSLSPSTQNNGYRTLHKANSYSMLQQSPSSYQQQQQQQRQASMNNTHSPTSTSTSSSTISPTSPLNGLPLSNMSTLSSMPAAMQGMPMPMGTAYPQPQPQPAYYNTTTTAQAQAPPTTDMSAMNLGGAGGVSGGVVGLGAGVANGYGYEHTRPASEGALNVNANGHGYPTTQNGSQPQGQGYINAQGYYEHSPYTGSAESYSPSSSSNNGGAAPSAPAKKYTNACKRCRRQKMRCTFRPGAHICTRCLLGSHQCVLEERKSRNPGELEIVRNRLRQTTSRLDAALDKLRDVNTSQYQTPLAFVPNRLALSTEQRDELRDVLGNVVGAFGGKRVGGVNMGGAGTLGGWVNSGTATGMGGGMEDVSALLMLEEGGSDGDGEGGSEDEVGSGGTGSGNESEAEPLEEGSEGGSELGYRKRGRRRDTVVPRAAAGSVGGAGYRIPSGGSPANEGVLPDSMTPLGFIAQATMEEEVDHGGYFQSNPLKNASLRSILIARGDEAPPILAHGLFTIKDVETLFDLYFQRIHPIVALLDPAIHTPSAVLVRSSFLFTVICAIACRFLEDAPSSDKVEDPTSTNGKLSKVKTKKRSAAEMDHEPPSAPSSASKPKSSSKTTKGLAARYPLALHYAKAAAASALVDGRKDVEMVQAYILMALYAPNGKRFEESRTLFYSGVASTVAVELGLHRISEVCPTERGGGEREAREWHNLIRTWIVTFNLDRCYAVQYGKPMALKEDFHVLNKDWYRLPYANAYDVHLHGHTDILRIMARFHQNIRGERNAANITLLIEAFEKEVDDVCMTLKEQYLAEADLSDEGCKFRLCLAEFVTSYSRLLVLSHGLQQSFEDGAAPDPALLTNAIMIATAAIKAFVDKIASLGFWRYSPDCYFIYSGYCSTFLLKLIDPKFPYQFDTPTKERIIALVSGLVGTLASPSIALDETHTPKLYAGFLAGLLKRVGAGIREGKRMKVGSAAGGGGGRRQRTDESERVVSPPPDSSSSATEGEGDLSGLSRSPSVDVPPRPTLHNGRGDSNAMRQNPLPAFPTSSVPQMQSQPQPQTQLSGEDLMSIGNTYGTMQQPQTQTQWATAPATTSPLSAGGHHHSSVDLTWADLYAEPDSLDSLGALGSTHPSHHTQTHSNLNMLNGHSMSMGSEWQFSADPVGGDHPYSKWGMEELVPPVRYLVPADGAYAV